MPEQNLSRSAKGDWKDMHARNPNKHEQFTRRLLTDQLKATLICRYEHHQKILKEGLLSLNWNFSFPAVSLLEPVARQKEETFRRRTMEKIRSMLEQDLKDSAAVFLTNEGRIGLRFSWQSKGLIERAKNLVASHLSVETTIGVGNRSEGCLICTILTVKPKKRFKGSFTRAAGESFTTV